MVKISCSNVAKLTGFHPYSDLPTSIVELVYQDRESMRRSDSKSWNIVWVSEEETVDALLAKTQNDLKTHMRKIGKERNLNEVRQNESKFLNAIKKNSHVLTEQERDLLASKARHDMYTNFGKNYESEALKVYEKKTGREVRDSNSTKYFWAFPSDRNRLRAPNLLIDGPGDQGWIEDLNRCDRDEDVYGVVEGFVIQHQKSNKLYRHCLLGNGWLTFPSFLRKRDRFLIHRTAERFGLAHDSEGEGTMRRVTIRRNESVRVDQSSIDVANCVKDMVDALSSPYEDNAMEDFKKRNVNDSDVVLTGMVDGIAQEIYYEEEMISMMDELEVDEEEEDLTIQEDNMRLRNIVIEIKHRMVKSANSTPPLYDQIQCVAYVACE